MEIVKKASRRLKESKLIGDGAAGGNLVSYLRGDSYLYRSLRSPSVLLSYYLIILLSYCLFVLLFKLSYCPIVLLSDYIV